MCDICLKSPCDNRCPSAPESQHIICQCDNQLYEGDEYFDIDGEIFCEKCIDGYLDVYKQTVDFCND